MMAALPKLVETLDMTTGQSTWIISGFQLTFAAFLLIVSVIRIYNAIQTLIYNIQSGKISDIYNPSMQYIICGQLILNCKSEYAFAFGILSLGAIALGSGFVRNKIVLIVLRALAGICKNHEVWRTHYYNLSLSQLLR